MIAIECILLFFLAPLLIAYVAVSIRERVRSERREADLLRDYYEAIERGRGNNNNNQKVKS